MNRHKVYAGNSWLVLSCILLWAYPTLGGAQDRGEEQFLDSVRATLPSHSALPPVSDLPMAMAAYANRAWEEKYRNMEGLIKRDVSAVPEDDSSTPGSIALTTKEESGGVALPARDATAIVVGTALSSGSHIALNKHLVYSDYHFSVKKVFKGSTTGLKIDRSGVDVLLFGGGIRFPSGHTEYFVINGVGFLQQGQDYLLFLWKSVKGMRAYDVLAAYLLDGGGVHPIVGGGNGRYSGRAVSELELAVKSAIRANANQ